MNSLNNKPGVHRLVQVFKVWNRQARGLRYHHQIDPGAQSGPGAQSESCWSVINVMGVGCTVSKMRVWRKRNL